MHILNTKDGNTSCKHLFLTEFVTNGTARKKRVTMIFIIFPGGGIVPSKKRLRYNKNCTLI